MCCNIGLQAFFLDSVLELEDAINMVAVVVNLSQITQIAELEQFVVCTTTVYYW